MSDPSVLSLREVSKSFKEGDAKLSVLEGISFSLNQGKVLSLLGPSGSGKSTLLHIAGLLDRPNQGHVWIQGQETSSLPESKRTHIRREAIGFIYQFHHLLAEFTALENVVIPQLIQGESSSKAEARAKDLLTQVGLKERLYHFPSELSGGEQQRVAIARALANKPKILLADEPTGNLDPHTSALIFKLILDLAHTQGLAALIVTHNAALASQTDQVLTLTEGIIC